MKVLKPAGKFPSYADIYFSEKAETTPFSIFWPGPEILLIIYLVTSVTTLLRILIMKNQERRSIF